MAGGLESWLRRKFGKGEEETQRSIIVGRSSFDYVDNFVVTSKYHFYDFLPRNLFEQFTRLANFYFLLSGLIQFVPGITSLNPVLNIMPLVIVLAVSAIKEAREDYFRHKQDDETNNQYASVYRPESDNFKEVLWKDIRVGDIIRVYDREFIPADVVVLKTHSKESICYIETANLDGETNLKMRQAHPETDKLVDDSESRKSLVDAKIQCEAPNSALYKFEGNITLSGQHTLPLDNNQVLLRGCQLRNTEWADGVVIFAGHDSKLMKNASDSQMKTSSIEKSLNFYIITVFSILVGVSILSGFLGGNHVEKLKKKAWYLDFPDNENSVTYGGLGCITYILLYNTLIPISLYISIEMVKLVQAFLINSDLDMYYAPTDTPARARTSNLSDELGEIQYIFSDKTGTLTRNIMEFRKCSIGGYVYSIPEENNMDKSNASEMENNIFQDLGKKNKQSEAIAEFLLHLSICHSVIPEKSKSQPDSIDAIIYQAASPDEAALVSAARSLGFKFKQRSPESVIVQVQGEDQEWKILNVVDFTSDRKRMTVVVKSPKGEIIVLCKGADSILMPRFAPGQESVLTKMQLHLDNFAVDGLRTLAMGSKTITADEYAAWSERYRKASISLQNREELVNKCAEEIEHSFRFVGASAIEDKLQEGVPECISTLRRAGMKIWVLTGDKRETAINIGHACRLIDREMPLVVLSSNDAKEISQTLSQHTTEYLRRQQENHEKVEVGFVIDGHTLAIALEGCADDFVEFARRCKSVICCRVSPSQKAQIVAIMKSTQKAITLAIGDGANDVSMIKEAHIGIGISGQEGMQAVMSSDYAIAQFRFLTPLLLLHGRWSYIRVSQIIRYCFYKNFCFTLSNMWFAIYCAFSGQTFLDSFYISVFNVFYTALPIMGLAVFEQDVSKESMYKYPQLYYERRIHDRFDGKSYTISIFDGFVHSIICFYFPYLAFQNVGANMPSGHGGGDGVWVLGTTAFTCIIFTANLRVSQMTKYWTNWNIFFVLLSVFGWFIVTMMYHGVNAAGSAEIYYVIFMLYQMPAFWFTIISAPIACCSIDYAIESAYSYLRPSCAQIVRELEYKNSYLPSGNKVSKIDPPYNGADSQNSPKIPAEARGSTKGGGSYRE